MFAYCNNNPVNHIDSTGQSWSDVGNIFKKVGKAISEAAIAGFNAVKKFGKATIGSFQCEVGYGVGFGLSGQVGPVKAIASAYHDGTTIGFKNTESYTSIKGSAALSVQLTEKIELGPSTEYEHRYETNLVRDLDEHNFLSMPWSVYNCPKTDKESDEIFIGIDVAAHLGIGGHFTIGWDGAEFWRIITE